MRNILGPVAILCSISLLPADMPDLSHFDKKLSKDEEILHALDRLTFGPRPGDVATVKRMGLQKWIDLQLHPEQIAENPELDRHLKPLESLRMSQADTMASYPSPQLIRAVALGRQALPDDPVARAAVVSQVARLDDKRQVPDDQPLPPRIPLTTLLSRQQIQTLRNGTVEQRKAVLASIPPSKIDDFAIALQSMAGGGGAKPNGAKQATKQAGNPGGGNLRNQLLAAASPELRRKLMLAVSPQQVVVSDLSEGKLFHAIYGNRQLEEVLADFWFNHFNVDLNKGADRFLVPTYERDSIRPHVLGKFRDLLEATATSPAMMFYLDNWQSTTPLPARPNAGKNPKQAAKQAARGLNENYARELMELHTMGVDGGYTQQDIIEVARCFTGWTINQPNLGGSFLFNDRMHDKGEKTVLGVTIPGRRRAGRRREGARHFGQASFHRDVHLARIGPAFCGRRSASGSPRSHVANVPQQRRRH